MRIAAVQPAMASTVRKNLAKLVSATRVAASAGADLVLLPELALTGFHRGLREVANDAVLRDAMRELRSEFSAGPSVIAGTPWFEGEAIYNALVAVQEGAWVAKRGLTPSEARFFSPAPSRGTLRVGNLRLGAVFCREVEDQAAIVADFTGHVDLVLWPSYITWAPSDDYVRLAADLAARLGVPVVQANWPQSLNQPDVSGLGGSYAFSPTGAIVGRGPEDAASIVLIDLVPGAPVEVRHAGNRPLP